MTPADARIITERARPSYKSSIVCAEPSPDIAKALSTLIKLSGGNGAVNGGVGVATTQSVSALAGRTASVVALRDGLFKACEAYANGVITSRSYSLILSNYGDILVTLMLGEDIASVNAVAAPATAAPAAVNLDFAIPGAPSSPPASQKGASGGKAAGTDATTPPAATDSATTPPGSAAAASVDVGQKLAASADSYGSDANATSATAATDKAKKAGEAKAKADKAKKDAAAQAAADQNKKDAAAKAADTSKVVTDASNKPTPAAGMSAAEAIRDIAQLFLVEGAATRIEGSLITLCLTGTPSSQYYGKATYEHDSEQYDRVCRALPEEMKGFFDLQAKIRAAQLRTEEAKAEEAETNQQIAAVNLARAKK